MKAVSERINYVRGCIVCGNNGGSLATDNDGNKIKFCSLTNLPTFESHTIPTWCPLEEIIIDSAHNIKLIDHWNDFEKYERENNLGFRKLNGYVYFVEVQKGIYKIGATGDITQRIKTIQTYSPYKIKLRYEIFCDNILLLENNLHTYFDNNKIEGEFFKLEDEYIIKGLKDILPNFNCEHPKESTYE